MHIHLFGTNDKEAALVVAHTHTGNIYNAAIGTNELYGQSQVWVPTWELVGGHKRGKGNTATWCQKHPVVTDEQYTEAYSAILDSRKAQIDTWLAREERLGITDIGLTCFCPSVQHRNGDPKWDFCHLDAIEIWLWSKYGRTVKVTRY